jgi:hypothetical protein
MTEPERTEQGSERFWATPGTRDAETGRTAELDKELDQQLDRELNRDGDVGPAEPDEG